MSLPWTAWARPGRVAVVLVVAFAVLFASVGAAHPPQSVAATEMSLQPCFAGEGDCVSAPVSTSDGRILVQVVPVYEGEAQVFLEDEGRLSHVFTCRSPSVSVVCSAIIETKMSGTYRIVARFGPTATGALLLEVVTPS